MYEILYSVNKKNAKLKKPILPVFFLLIFFFCKKPWVLLKNPGGLGKIKKPLVFTTLVLMHAIFCPYNIFFWPFD